MRSLFLLLAFLPALAAAQPPAAPPAAATAADAFPGSRGDLADEATIAAPKSPHAHWRGGLQNARRRFETTKRGRVAFLGGSITEMEGYRPLLMDYLQKRFPETEFTFTNAGISSTCSTTGAFRLERDVLSAEPDLLFVEFAVNDDQDAGHGPRECVRGMEGIVRHALHQRPEMDLVIMHFLNPRMLAQLQAGKEPRSSRQHEQVAAHYGISSAYVAREVADRIAAGKLTWETYGGTHPQPPGNRLAADLVIDLCEAAWSTPRDPQAEPTPHALPAPLDPNSYVRGRLLPLDIPELGEGWAIRRPDWQALPGSKRERFTDRALLCADDPGAELMLSFEGTAVGAYLLAGPDAGMLEYAVDGGGWKTVDLYHHYSKGLHYPRTVMLATDLAAELHTVRVRVASEHAPASRGTAARILAFVAN